AAFNRKDAIAAGTAFADDVVRTIAGNSAISGTFTGKAEIMQMWALLGEFVTEPRIFAADHDHVVVIAVNSANGVRWDAADVYTFENGKIKSFTTIEDPAAVERAYPRIA
ncbi:MAG: nuclear transport factor 2 family protein, partial [Salinisphaera sp.]|nr:nuclear transport factor 2 family protein [Salinisphaera sp.]